MDLYEVGGKRIIKSAGDVGEAWDFGWIPFDRRTAAQRAADAESASQLLPSFSVSGSNVEANDAKKACLWETWADPRVIAAVGGYVYPGTHQLTGSCVGAGGGNMIFCLSAIEVVRLGDPEQALIPFWLLPYGRSRYYLGDRGPGEGSTGTTFAKAVQSDGVIPANTPGLPSFTHDDGLVWGKSAEMIWSDGGRIEGKWLEESRKHLIRTAAPIKNADEMREAIKNGYPVTWCGNWGGLMQCEVKGTPPVLMNRHASSWSHQQSAHGWWDHPELGEIFFILNQWGLTAHGKDPSGGPPGGYWIKKADADWQCRNGECYAFSQFDGFPAPDYRIPWVF